MPLPISFEELKDRFSLVAILSKLGYEPVRYSGGEHFYRSMLRQGDRTPSFCVNDKLGLWFDHGLGKGGTIIDFAKDYWSITAVRDAAQKILECMGESNSYPTKEVLPKQMEIPLRFPSYHIKGTSPIEENKIIQSYLASRGLSGVAENYLQVLNYSIKPEGKQRMNFSAAAWQNDLGGWEVRNASFKGCLGAKGINFFPNDSHKLGVFEGMMDFLSFKAQHQNDKSSVLILNSLSMLSRATPKLKDFPIIDIFFDHDAAGRKATEVLALEFPWIVDRSYLYQGYNDYNEMHQDRLKVQRQHLQSKEDTFYKHR